MTNREGAKLTAPKPKKPGKKGQRKHIAACVRGRDMVGCKCWCHKKPKRRGRAS